ncbi:unnamed protein product, partial [Polarella glacialis]
MPASCKEFKEELGKLARSRFRRGDKTVPMEQGSRAKSATGQRDLLPLPIPRWLHDRLERELDDECRPLAKRSKRSVRKAALGVAPPPLVWPPLVWPPLVWPPL